MLAALPLLAALAIGPERAAPVPELVPAGRPASVAAIGKDFVLAWAEANSVYAQRIDGATGQPATQCGIRIATASLSAPPAIASNGTTALVAFPGQYALLGNDVQPRVVVPVAPASVGVAVASFGDRYLLLTASSAKTADGRFIDAKSGEMIGPTFSVNSGGEMSVASNGSTALLVTATPFAAYLITRDGSATRLSLTNVTMFIARSPRVAWDDSAYVVSWTELPTVYVTAFDGSGAQTRAPAPFTTTQAVPAALVATGGGSTLFLSDGRFVRLASGGIPIAAVPVPLVTKPPLAGIASAAYNGRAYFVADSLRVTGAITNLIDVTPVQTAAFTAPWQTAPLIVSGRSAMFVAWGEQDEKVAMVRNGDFVAPGRSAGPNTGTFVSPHHSALAATDDGAAIATIESTATNVRFVGADGSIFPAQRIGDGASSVPGEEDETALVATTSSRFIGVWCQKIPTGYVVQQYGTTTAVAFSAGNVSNPVKLVGANRVAATPYRDGALIALIDGTVGVVQLDANARVIGNMLILNGVAPGGVAIATDGGDHVLVVWSGSAWAIDWSTKQTRAVALAIGINPHVTWDGNAFLVVDDDLDLRRVTRTGDVVGPWCHIETPVPAHDVAIASGPAGTAIVYARRALDLGTGDVDRVFLRMITDTPTRPHPGGK